MRLWRILLCPPVLCSTIVAGSISAAHAAELTLDPCTKAAESQRWEPPRVVGRGGELEFEAFVDAIADHQVIIIGESHDRLDHHLTQLEIICLLHRRFPDLVIGVEFFQQPFQTALDDYVEGRIDEAEMLRGTEYYRRWRYDYRLYEPLFAYARRNRIPIIALNVPSEITYKVSQGGLGTLDVGERAQIPDELDRSDPGYRKRVFDAFSQHPDQAKRNFDHFFEAQLLWDEGMAEQAAEFVEAHPEKRMVVLTGVGHALRSGIPARLARRTDASIAVVIPGPGGSLDSRAGDYLYDSDLIDLPRAGLLGVMLSTTSSPLTVEEFGEKSAARDAGLMVGDRIVAVNDQPVEDFADVKLALLRKQPGETVTLSVLRPRESLEPKSFTLDVTLR